MTSGQRKPGELVSVGKLVAAVVDEYGVDIPAATDAAAREARQCVDDERAATDRLHRRRLLVRWGVPVKDVERICVADELFRTEPLAKVQTHHEGILVLGGNIGCGKTTASAWWLAQPGSTSPYLDTHDPLFIPTYRFERLSRYNDEQMLRVEHARRLVVDDVGTEFLDTKGNFVALLRALIDSRYADSLPMIITTNLKPSEFSERYGPRSIDRLREVGRYSYSDAPSLRGRHGK